MGGEVTSGSTSGRLLRLERDVAVHMRVVRAVCFAEREAAIVSGVGLWHPLLEERNESPSIHVEDASRVVHPVPIAVGDVE